MVIVTSRTRSVTLLPCKFQFIVPFQALPFGHGRSPSDKRLPVAIAHNKWGAPPKGGRERCNKKLRYYQCFGENVLPVHLFRHGIRRATFPRGEGKGAAAPVQQNDKLQFIEFHTPSKGNDRSRVLQSAANQNPHGCRWQPYDNSIQRM